MENSYRQATYWDEYSVYFKDLYIKKSWTFLRELNIELILLVKDILGIDTEIITSSELKIENQMGSDRNLSICKYLDADVTSLEKALETTMTKKSLKEKRLTWFIQIFTVLSISNYGESSSLTCQL